jgi:hypothetical protein
VADSTANGAPIESASSPSSHRIGWLRRRRADQAVDPKRQGDGRERQGDAVDQRLGADALDALQGMGVRVAGQQRDLEERHRGVPDRGAAAQERQDQLGDHRLDQEHQRRAGEHGHREQGGGGWARRASTASVVIGFSNRLDRLDRGMLCP